MKKNSQLPIVLRNREPVAASEFPRGEYDPARSISILNGIPLVEFAKPYTTITEAPEGIDEPEASEAGVVERARGKNRTEEGLGVNNLEFGVTTTTRTIEGIDQPEASEIMSVIDGTGITFTEEGIDTHEASESLDFPYFNPTSVTATREAIDQSESLNDCYE